MKMKQVLIFAFNVCALLLLTTNYCDVYKSISGMHVCCWLQTLTPTTQRHAQIVRILSNAAGRLSIKFTLAKMQSTFSAVVIANIVNIFSFARTLRSITVSIFFRFYCRAMLCHMPSRGVCPSVLQLVSVTFVWCVATSNYIHRRHHHYHPETFFTVG